MFGGRIKECLNGQGTGFFRIYNQEEGQVAHRRSGLLRARYGLSEADEIRRCDSCSFDLGTGLCPSGTK